MTNLEPFYNLRIIVGKPQYRVRWGNSYGVPVFQCKNESQLTSVYLFKKTMMQNSKRKNKYKLVV